MGLRNLQNIALLKSILIGLGNLYHGLEADIQKDFSQCIAVRLFHTAKSEETSHHSSLTGIYIYIYIYIYMLRLDCLDTLVLFYSVI